MQNKIIRGFPSSYIFSFKHKINIFGNNFPSIVICPDAVNKYFNFVMGIKIQL